MKGIIRTPIAATIQIVVYKSFFSKGIRVNDTLNILPTTSENVKMSDTKLIGAYLRALYQVKT